MTGVASGATDETASTGSLAGIWRRELDPDDQGLERGWHQKPLRDTLPFPGSLEQNGIGHAVTTETPWTGGLVDRGFFSEADYARYRSPGEIKVPFFLQPDSWYRGAAWYQREIEVPNAWRGKRISLFLERPHWETSVWIGDHPIGRSDALHVPHIHDLGTLQPGRHRLTIRVDNRMIVEIGHNSHGVTDHTQGNWNGIAGRIELRASEPVWIERVDLHPALRDHVLTVHGTLRRLADATPMAAADIVLAKRTTRVPVTWNGLVGSFQAIIRPNAADAVTLRSWDEFDPVLHDVTVLLVNGEEWLGRFGWRDLVPTPMGFTMNGRPAMLRGTLDCSIFPLTGHPPTDVESWRRIMHRVKDHGFNHLRFHSYCPPEAAFDAADELGLYVQVETVWANESVHVGGGLPVDRWIYAETDRILAAYGNHPSFVMMTHGNEPGSPKSPDGDARRDAFLGGYVRHYRALDTRRLWTSGAGWPEISDNQYHVTPSPRVQAWGEGLASRINSKPPETQTDYRQAVNRYPVPVVGHEIGQWCAYPNLNERRKYTGHLKAKNFDIFADRLYENGLQAFAPEFLYASGRLQLLCYKEEIESALRTPGFGGFQLLGLQDFPGQGTATVGVLDTFWDDKGYTTAAEYSRFCAPTVVLARMPTRVLQSGEPFAFSIDVAHFGPGPIEMAQIDWRIATADDGELAKGTFPARTVPLGNAPLDLSTAPVLKVSVASAASLTVTIRQAGQLIAKNNWDLWIYPVPVSNFPTSTRIRRADRIDAALLDHLASGGDALIGLDGVAVANYPERPVQLGFSSIFWNTLWTQRQAPTTLGILCDPHHAALADFPTDAHSNWQWWYPLHGAGALRLDLLPPNIEPIVRVIDDWFTARSLGLIVEVAVGRGRAIVCGFAIDGPPAQNPVTRQLVASLHRYMAGLDFKPTVRVTARQLQSLSVHND
ncbi:glycosyl hydrolase family 2 [Sphingomonas sp. PP-F2F-A104-K0414]|uniref:sugar-binding domain-containing protein n=1 Tax=Sphingomonas sp. PP-F2F-A104-K0414 TaxID=2135661 RepID=UPI001044EF4A|nr:sugar-binding domain-containing protein [Sphingomonas sp. PP-F2F-A104-K0414]TCP96405.1 glycosyl hydrolase family 2 [Sphingomonas sp. PP-F2F-A104-K0414]